MVLAGGHHHHATPAPEGSTDEEASAPVDLNAADQPALEKLPGIGPAKAQAIIAERTRAPFASVDDLSRVKGFGPKVLEKLRPLVKVEPRAQTADAGSSPAGAAPAPLQADASSAAPPPAAPSRPLARKLGGPEDEPPSGKLNLNLADEKALLSLPGIGPGKAKAIMARRADRGPFRSLAEFRDLPGVGDRLYRDLIYFVTVKVDVNVAATGDLRALGMPEAAAKLVIAARDKAPLRSLAEIRAASKLSEAEFAQLQPLLYVAP